MRIMPKALSKRAWPRVLSAFRIAHTQDVELLEEKLTYALNEISDLRQIIRNAGLSAELAQAEQTKQSFEYQWKSLTEGAGLVGDSAFDRKSIELACEYTGMSEAQFQGATVLDVGCGNGRWSLTFCKLGARVTSIDASEHGLKNVNRLCSSFEGFSSQVVDVLKPVNLDTKFDLVWSFGVLHHTGNTYAAFKNIEKLVKPGGKLFLMIYGEPRPSHPEDYVELNTYTRLRRETKNMGFDEKVEYLKKQFREDLVHGYFDAISPAINDLHRFDEVETWLLSAGYSEVKIMADNRNHFISATKGCKANA